MKTLHLVLVTVTFCTFTLLFSACATPGVADARQSGVERRQDRIDSRTGARQDRWSERADREDARAKARFDSW